MQGNTAAQDGLKVSATGSWSLKVTPIGTAPLIKFPVAGKRSSVYLYLGDASDWAITHNGNESFIVDMTRPAGDSNNLVNETGDYSGTVAASPGPVLIAITSDGVWTIKGA